MKIVKKINTSAAIAIDSAGREIVALGKGIGFPPCPYELTDLSKIERTFYDVDFKYVEMITDIPVELLTVCAKIVEDAEIELECEFNPNIAFTLADHLNFAIQRIKDGICFSTPLAYEIRNLYKKEYKISLKALDMLKEENIYDFPVEEAASIAMHIINAEHKNSSLEEVMRHIQIISTIISLVEKDLNVVLDKDSYSYSRFEMHLRFLIKRLSAGKQIDDDNGETLNDMKRKNPAIYGCALHIAKYFEDQWNWSCQGDEILYLMIHLKRIK